MQTEAHPAPGRLALAADAVTLDDVAALRAAPKSAIVARDFAQLATMATALSASAWDLAAAALGAARREVRS